MTRGDLGRRRVAESGIDRQNSPFGASFPSGRVAGKPAGKTGRNSLFVLTWFSAVARVAWLVVWVWCVSLDEAIGELHVPYQGNGKVKQGQRQGRGMCSEAENR